MKIRLYTIFLYTRRNLLKHLRRSICRNLEPKIEKPKPEKQIHQCETCKKVFKFSSRLRDHIQIFHFGQRFECPLCDVTFTAKQIRDKHIRSIHENQKILCSQCPHRSVDQYALKSKRM